MRKMKDKKKKIKKMIYPCCRNFLAIALLNNSLKSEKYLNFKLFKTYFSFCVEGMTRPGPSIVM